LICLHLAADFGPVRSDSNRLALELPQTSPREKSQGHSIQN
jgi:hypothetical protein